ncbi:small integral membrane protein 30 [Echeneis naucrates]|uniref:small integral membrane protein 30 n=1 Tax=Echeneis naucrates TaxID=173247 RepID=UPI0011145BB3|nr:small integral membrane protein 30 [Echeneis naucrates]
MAPDLELPKAAAMIIVLLVLCSIPPVEAYDSGDALALLLGAVLTVVGFCACLGWYARRRNDRL